MKTTEVALSTAWQKVAEPTDTEFLFQLLSDEPWFFAVNDEATAPTISGHMILGIDRQVSGPTGGHAYARMKAGKGTLTVTK